MEIDLQKAYNRFTEIVARSLDVYDQQQEGQAIHFDHDRWKRRYNGTPWDELPPMTIEYNRFRPVVDGVVSQLMLALDDDAWAKATAPIPGLIPLEDKQ